VTDGTVFYKIAGFCFFVARYRQDASPQAKGERQADRGQSSREKIDKWSKTWKAPSPDLAYASH
jgi:hypothetical protein